MSSVSSAVMSTTTTTKKDKQYANRGARRHSLLTSHSKKHKKDSDSDSVSSSSITVPPAPPKPQCPLRPYMQPIFEAMFEPDPALEKQNEDVKSTTACPLRRIRMSHTVPLFTILMMNLWLIALTLILTAICRAICTISIRGSGFMQQTWASFITADPTRSAAVRCGIKVQESPPIQLRRDVGASTSLVH